jgi:exonuclease I
MRFGIGLTQDYTLEEVGLKFDVTRERIRQIEVKALRSLKHPSRGDTLRELIGYYETTAEKDTEAKRAQARWKKAREDALKRDEARAREKVDAVLRQEQIKKVTKEILKYESESFFLSP